jgi:hypothetical protein
MGLLAGRKDWRGRDYSFVFCWRNLIYIALRTLRTVSIYNSEGDGLTGGLTVALTYWLEGLLLSFVKINKRREEEDGSFCLEKSDENPKRPAVQAALF